MPVQDWKPQPSIATSPVNTRMENIPRHLERNWSISSYSVILLEQLSTQTSQSRRKEREVVYPYIDIYIYTPE